MSENKKYCDDPDCKGWPGCPCRKPEFWKQFDSLRGAKQERRIMKTIDSKARVVCHKLKLPDDGPAFSIIRNALKEQDRDARHACADAIILKLAPYDDSDFGEIFDLQDIRTSLHNTIMNTKAI